MKPIYTILISAFLASCSKDEQLSTSAPDPVPAPSPAPVPEQNKPIVETQPPVLTAVTKKIHSNIGGYYEALPVHYKTSKLNYPLLIFVHGLGQRGNGSSDLNLLTKEGITKRLADKTFPASIQINKAYHSFIVLAPQFNEFETPAALDAFVNHASRTYRIDKSRIYLVGMSMGGRMIVDYAWKYPGKAAAIVPMAGVCKSDEDMIAKAKSIATGRYATWVLHNRGDELMPFDDADKLVAEINKNKPSIAAILTELSDAGEAKHDSWTRGCDPAFRKSGKNIYEWMLQYKR